MVTTKRVSDQELRRAFNASGLYERAQTGDVFTTIEENEPDPAYNQPKGAVSRTWTYWETRKGEIVKLAIAHAFVLKDGTINNKARRPDPKYVRVGDVILMQPRQHRPRTSLPPPPPRQASAATPSS